MAENNLLLSIEQREKKQLRKDLLYVAVLMLSLEAVFTFTGIVYGICCAIFLLRGTAQLLAYMASYVIGMAFPAVVVSLAFNHRYFPFSSAKRTNAPDVCLSIVSSMGICMLANIVASYIVAFFESVGVEKPQLPDYLQSSPISLLLNIFVFAVLPALLEEMVFRGYILRILRSYGDWFAVAVSTCLFGLMHGNIEQVPFALIVGFALGWLYVMTDNIWVPVAMHFANNALSYVIQYASFGMNDNRRIVFNAFVMLALIALGLICFGILYARSSAMLRRLPSRSSLSVIRRVGVVFTSPLFVICVAALTALMFI